MTETYEVLSPVGVLVRTFDTADAARRWVLANKLTLPGLRIDRVQTIVQRTPVYRPRAVRAA